MKLLRILMTVAMVCLAGCAEARNMSADLGKWRIIYDRKTSAFTLKHEGKTILTGSQPEASCRLEGKELLLSTANLRNASMEKLHGDTVRYVFSDAKNVHSIEILVDFALADNALLTRLTLRAESELASNYLAPLCINRPQVFRGRECRMLKVPFDNDDFVRYIYHRLDTAMLSYEVSTIFDGESRQGIVIGSVDHDHWKSGVEAEGKGGDTIVRLRAYSGVSTKETRDVLPHGAMTGKEVSSATFLIEENNDFRDGMEHFASVCNARQPGRNTWQGGTPMGWQSWGVMAMKNNFDVDMAVADFYATTLRQGGFAGDNGLQIMSIDAWDNLNDTQRRQLTAHCAEQGQIAGIYRSPFCLWWDNDNDLEQKLFDGCTYTARACVLTANGKPLKYDGAYCLDPTHPAVQARMDREMEEARQQGFRYVKVDFVCNGIIQADSYYNPEVRTAVEAYNEGMKHFVSQCFCSDGTPMFIALSIAPIFPYQYGNSRRIACDTWGKIGQSEYAI